jgi:hypothetical protein
VVGGGVGIDSCESGDLRNSDGENCFDGEGKKLRRVSQGSNGIACTHDSSEKIKFGSNPLLLNQEVELGL